MRQGGIEGEVGYLDRFGNAITNLEGKLVQRPAAASCEVYARCRLVCPLKAFFQAVPAKTPVAIVGSSGFVEIAVNRGSAEKALGIKLSDRVVLRMGSSGSGQ